MDTTRERTGPAAATGTLTFLFTDIAGSTRLYSRIVSSISRRG